MQNNTEVSLDHFATKSGDVAEASSRRHGKCGAGCQRTRNSNCSLSKATSRTKRTQVLRAVGNAKTGCTKPTDCVGGMFAQTRSDISNADRQLNGHRIHRRSTQSVGLGATVDYIPFRLAAW